MKGNGKWLLRGLILPVLAGSIVFSALPAPAQTNRAADVVVGAESGTQQSEVETETEISTETVQPRIDHEKLAVFTGSTMKLTVENAGSSVEWSSKKPNVAAVDSQGRVTGLKAGTTRVFAKIASL